MLYPCFTGRLSCCALLACLAIAHTASAATVTWTGNGDGQSWDLPSNWSGSAVPGTTDDVVHSNSDTIQMNIGTPGSPTIIKSFTATGSAGGALVIQGSKGLRVTGNFTNSSTGVLDRYELSLGTSAKLELDSATGAADIVRVDVSMSAGGTGSETTLIVDGEIIDGSYEADAHCDINVGLSTISSLSVLSGEWLLSDGAEATFAFSMISSATDPLSITLEDGSTMTVLQPAYSGGTFYGGDETELLFGLGANTFAIGQVGAEYPAFDLGYDSIIAAIDNTGTLTLDLYGKTAIRTFFGTVNTRGGWDSRAVDVLARPIEQSDAVNLRLEQMSTDMTAWDPADPVVFLDIPCWAVWRDLTLSNSTSTTLAPVPLTDEWNSSITDGDLSSGFGSANEVGYYRDITIGDNRTIKNYLNGPIYYYGDLTISTSGTVMDVDTPVTGSAIDDVITFACGTIYGDWNGDCEITTAELNDLRDAVLGGSSTYNPLYDSNCDGELTAGVERAKAAANYLIQPTCECGGESMMFGGGGSSSEEIEAVAAWFVETMSSAELAQFLVDLVDAIDEFSDQPVAEDMSALLVALGG